MRGPNIVEAGVCVVTFWCEGFLQPLPWAFIIERDKPRGHAHEFRLTL